MRRAVRILGTFTRRPNQFCLSGKVSERRDDRIARLIVLETVDNIDALAEFLLNARELADVSADRLIWVSERVFHVRIAVLPIGPVGSFGLV
jgi:hypothetical protein